MCGLFVSVGYAPDKRGIDAAAHRGPDGEGWETFDSPAGPVALGHRRLSIIDLDARASQPMASSDRRLRLVYNGEIYNYREIRDDLAASGVAFRSNSDAEVLLEAFRAYGPAALDRLVGMFAFAIWDDVDKTLFLARDRFGIKPLFWHASPAGIAFASEIKQLLTLPTFSRKIQLDRAVDFLATGVTDHSAQTLFADAQSVLPGHCLALDLKSWRPGEAPAMRPYWTPPKPEPSSMDEAAAAARFRELFFDSVAMHLRADVRVGACLSGGLDSASIVCTQAMIAPSRAAPFIAVSAVFPNSAVDEARYAQVAAQAAGAELVRVTLDPAALFADAAGVIRAQDEPYGSSSVHAQHAVFRAAKDAGVKVMLDGQGADEILGGYHGCFHHYYAGLLRRFRIGEFMRALSERKAWHDVGLREQLSTLPVFRSILNPRADAAEFLAPAAAAQDAGLGRLLAQRGIAPPDDLGALCVALTQSTSLPMLLRYEDRNSMAFGVEARVPFLDHRLVEFALKLGGRHKIVGGETKRILRSAMQGVLPEPIRARRDKIGFATPEEAWLKGPLRREALAAVDAALALYPTLFDADAARKRARDMLEGARAFDFSLWRIMNFGLWGGIHGMRL